MKIEARAYAEHRWEETIDEILAIYPHELLINSSNVENLKYELSSYLELHLDELNIEPEYEVFVEISEEEFKEIQKVLPSPDPLDTWIKAVRYSREKRELNGK